MGNFNLAFDRALLRVTFREVRAVCPQARARDAAVVRGPLGQWFFQLPERAHYGKGSFSVNVRACDAYHAKALGWQEWLRERGKKEG
jgi:hypothetical protein